MYCFPSMLQLQIHVICRLNSHCSKSQTNADACPKYKYKAYSVSGAGRLRGKGGEMRGRR